MIGPGWLPRPPVRVRKRILAYTRPRRKRHDRGAHAARAHHGEDLALELIYAGAPAALPTAVALPHRARAHARVMWFALRAWLAARWSWMRPRMVPGVAAALGFVAIVYSADYLSHVRGTPIRYGQPAPARSCSLQR